MPCGLESILPRSSFPPWLYPQDQACIITPACSSSFLCSHGLAASKGWYIGPRRNMELNEWLYHGRKIMESTTKVTHQCGQFSEGCRESGEVNVQASLSLVPIPVLKFPQRDLWLQEPSPAWPLPCFIGPSGSLWPRLWVSDLAHWVHLPEILEALVIWFWSQELGV